VESKLKVALVTGEKRYRNRCAAALAEADAELIASDSPEGVTDWIRIEEPATVLVDLDMPFFSKGEHVRRLSMEFPRIPVIAVSRTADAFRMKRLFRNAAFDFVLKSAGTAELAEAVREAAAFHRELTQQWVRNQTACQYADELGVVKAISEAASSGEGLQDLFDRIVAKVADALGVEVVSLMLVDEEDPRYLKIVSASGLPEEVVQEARVAVGEGISGMVARENRSLLVEDIEKIPLFHLSPSGGRYRTRSLLTVPVCVRGECIGVLNVNDKTNGEVFTHNDLSMLETLCNQAGMAIENTRLYYDLARKARQLRETNLELDRLNRAKTDLIINLSHEFKTPLTGILGYADLMLSAKEGETDPEKTGKYLARIKEQSLQLERLSSRIFDFFAVTAGDHDWTAERIALSDLLSQQAKDLAGEAEKRSIRVETDLEPGIAVPGHGGYLARAVREILDNAVRFNREEGIVRLTARRDRFPDGRPAARIRVSDQGPGIPDEMRERIFQDFVQTLDIMVDKPEGLGLGLAMAHAIIEEHGGTLRLFQTGEAGTTFEILLPLESEATANPPTA